MGKTEFGTYIHVDVPSAGSTVMPFPSLFFFSTAEIRLLQLSNTQILTHSKNVWRCHFRGHRECTMEAGG